MMTLSERVHYRAAHIYKHPITAESLHNLADEINHLEAEIRALIKWGKTDNPIEERQCLARLPIHIQKALTEKEQTNA
jgi:hypothetical protein